MRWTRRRSDAESDDAERDANGDARRKPLVGYEDANGQARLADRRGREAGELRMPRKHALGDPPVEKELHAIGRIRRALVERERANREHGPRARIASAPEREEEAREQHAQLNARLGRLRAEVRPERERALRDAQQELADLDRTYRNLPLVERGLPWLNVGIVETLALAVAAFDAVFMGLPLREAGILNGNMRLVWVGAIAAVIYGAIHAAGIYGGMLSLQLSTRDRRQAATVLIVVVLVLLIAGLVLLGILRHDWTDQTNRDLRQGAGGESPFLDLLFLTPLQISAALGASGLLGVYVMGERGRELRADMAAATSAITACRDDLDSTERDIHEHVPNRIEQAALAVHEVRVDKARAEVELESIRDRTAADLEREEARTIAAINRYRVRYEEVDREYGNGGARRVRNPDGFWRHWRKRAVDEGPRNAFVRNPEPDPTDDQLFFDLYTQSRQ